MSSIGIGKLVRTNWIQLIKFNISYNIMKKSIRCTNLCALAVSLITFAIILHLVHNAYFPVHDNATDHTIIGTKVALDKQKPRQKASVSNSISVEKLRRNLAWSEFVDLKKSQNSKNSSLQTVIPAGYRNLISCPSTVVEKLKEPALKDKDFKWCLWAVDPKGGAVIVGKSWGKLTSEQRTKFDALNCNGVHANYNPSCDDAWGDNHIYKWRANKDYSIKCDESRSSSMNCYKNENNDKFCVLENVMIDFSKYEKIDNPLSSIPSKKFQQDFMSMDCHNGEKEPGFTFPHLFSPSLKSGNKVCDYVVEDTVLLYSHDNIRNIAHTLNDIMNVWLMLWLDKHAEHSANVTFLTIDALKQYNNFDDVINEFYTTYQYNFKSILRGVDFQSSTVCLRRVLTQPLPSRGFVWDNWHSDLPCSFLGPSSLYQRWNLHIRNSLNLLPPLKQQQQGSGNVKLPMVIQPIKIVFIVRTESKNDWGSYRSSRLILNIQEVKEELERFRMDLWRNSKKSVEIVLQNLAELSIEQQMLLLSQTSVLIGMHGAGISQSQYLPIGTPHCCGVIEIFPKGEFTPVRGFANMIRKMGASYDRIDIAASDCLDSGAKVPVQELRSKLQLLLDKVENTPSCVLPQVLSDPYLMTTTA